MQDAVLDHTASSQTAVSKPESAAAEVQPALPLRADTILGVCEAIGEEFGFHPNWLRVVFAAAVLWNPVVPIAVYLAIGAFVALARWYYPKPAPAAAGAAAAPHPAAANADHNPDRLAA